MVIEASHKFQKQLSAAEAIRLLAKYRKGALTLDAERQTDRWRLAQAAALDRRLLIGRCHIFKPPG